MAGESNTLTSLNSQFKYIQDKQQSLLPQNSVMLTLVPKISESTKEGRLYMVPVQLSHENGITFGNGDVFQLNNASAAAYGEVLVDAQPIVLVTQISESVANRMANSKSAFISESSLRTKVMYDSLARYLEISMLYGKSPTGIGTIASITYAGGAAVTATIVVTASQWAPGIWGSSKGMVLEAYYGSTLVSSGADSIFTATGAVVSTKTIAIKGTATGLAALASAVSGQTVYLMPQGAYTNDMKGIDCQIIGGTTTFNIDATVYPLWQGNSYDCLSAGLTMAKVLDGDGIAVGVGGLEGKRVLMVSAKTFGNLNADQAALRAYDGSYSGKEAKNGTRGITYEGCTGSIEVLVNNFVKEGEAFLLPVEHLKRIGARDLSLTQANGSGDYFKEIPGYAGYSLRAGAEFAILLERPAQAVKFINIVNS